MSLINIIASFECDLCGVQFKITVDPAVEASDGSSAYDLAEDAVKGSVDYEQIGDDILLGICSVQHGKHLCDACTTEGYKNDEP